MSVQFMGVVEKVGPDVKHIKEGDRVVACFDLACDQCAFSKVASRSVKRSRKGGNLLGRVEQR